MEEKDEDEGGEMILNVLGLNQGTIRLNGTPIPPRAWSSVGARALFYFILDRKQVSKDEIALTFWPDFSQAKVNSNFHATLWRVRKALGSKTVIEFENGFYQFSGEVQIYFDVDEFESLLSQIRQTGSPTERRTAMRRAMELYQTDYLIDIDMPWADDRRFELQGQFRAILSDLAADYFEKSNPASALEVYQLAVKLDPFQDEYHLRIMQCHATLGDVQSAKEHYHNYQANLEAEMGIQPDESLGEYLETLS
jgi:two-component SAPR family response regulator